MSGDNQFSVCVFYLDGKYEYKLRYDNVVRAFAVVMQHQSNSLIKRIIITDGGDRIVFEWWADIGIVWPPITLDDQIDEDLDK